MKDKAVGFYFTLVAALLSVAGAIIYHSVMYKMMIVYVFCVAAVAVTIVTLVISAGGRHPLFTQITPIVNAVLMACAAVWGVRLMVNQIGYVIAGLDEKSTNIALIYFEAVAVLAMLVNIIASFIRQQKA